MQIIRQQNARKLHFSIIPYGITMSKIFSFLFIVPNDSTISSFLPHPCRAQLLYIFDYFT